MVELPPEALNDRRLKRLQNREIDDQRVERHRHIHEPEIVETEKENSYSLPESDFLREEKSNRRWESSDEEEEAEDQDEDDIEHRRMIARQKAMRQQQEEVCNLLILLL